MGREYRQVNDFDYFEEMYYKSQDLESNQSTNDKNENKEKNKAKSNEDKKNKEKFETNKLILGDFEFEIIKRKQFDPFEVIEKLYKLSQQDYMTKEERERDFRSIVKEYVGG